MLLLLSADRWDGTWKPHALGRRCGSGRWGQPTYRWILVPSGLSGHST